jgi:uncharacterized protein YbjT (DUF2867 family)
LRVAKEDLMSNARLVLVTGATGGQGGAVVRALLRRGHRVRALTRRVTSQAAGRLRRQGADVVAGDFGDRASLARALRGVDAVYALTASSETGPAEETAHGIALVDAACSSRVAHLVYASAASADRATGVARFEAKAVVERYMAGAGVPYTIVAPVFFMENLLSPWTASDLLEGRLALPLPAARPLQQIALEDVGGFVAAVIERGSAVFGRRFDIAGDELSGEEAAAILADMHGRRIRYHGFPSAVLRAQSVDLARMYEWFDQTGYTADIEGLRDDFPEVGWHDFERWARQQDWQMAAPRRAAAT